MPLDEALHIARQIGEALEAAHDKGIIHRDLKRLTSRSLVTVPAIGEARILLDEPEEEPARSHKPLWIVAGVVTLTLMTTAVLSWPPEPRGGSSNSQSTSGPMH